MAANKIISLNIKDTRILIELIDRGLAYTDAYYRDYKKMGRISDEIFAQLKEQGLKSF